MGIMVLLGTTHVLHGSPTFITCFPERGRLSLIHGAFCMGATYPFAMAPLERASARKENDRSSYLYLAT